MEIVTLFSLDKKNRARQYMEFTLFLQYDLRMFYELLCISNK